jgi:phage terminase Nu1 subunit (DNA packaging protein)
MENDKILTRKDLSGILKIPVRTLDYLVATNQIPYSRIGKRAVRFHRDRISTWFAEREGIEYRRPGSNLGGDV